MFGKQLLTVIPICFVIGASMELFMIKTGFYTIVTKKEAERRALKKISEDERIEKLKQLGLLKTDIDPK